ncbi:MAG: hypothetical protein JNK54_10100 [Elusimicrobia bacterium]|nr:hypothetical protein [Elusimicrobiota bacterium]
MGKISTSRNKNHWATRLVGAVTAAAYLVTILGAAPAEASFWEDRAAARSRLEGNGGQSPTLLAQLPASQAFSFGSAIRPVPLVAPSPSLSKILASTPLWARRAVTPYADVRVVREGRSSDIRFFLVMDAHDVYSAQQNVARLLESLGSQGKMVVGVEGTTGAFDLDRHRGLLPSPAQEQLTDHLLKKGFINGPEAFGLTAPTVPHLWGVEDPALYDANVRAYRDSLSAEGETRSALAVLKKEGFERQKTVFSGALQKLDREVQAMHEDRGDLGRYATEISRGAGGGVGQHVQRFLDAKALEDKISFPAVEQARAAFIERLSPLLGTAEMAKLVQATTVFRTGGESAKDYYRMIEAVGLSKGVPLSAYPAFREYISYVSLADGIGAAQLMEELDALETRAYQRLATGEALSLAEWNKDLRLAERAVEHALTPLEWGQFEARREEWARLTERAHSLGFSTSAAETVQTQLPKFAAFFEAAEARNKTLLENTLAEARRQGANTAVLVTGGFHAPALEKRLMNENIPHAVLSPRVAEVPESGAGYLQAFAPTRTPLERLLLGERLFMNPPSATAVGTQLPSSPYNLSARTLNSAEMVYGVTLAEDPASFAENWNRQNPNTGRVSVQAIQEEGTKSLRISFVGANQEILVATDQTERSLTAPKKLAAAVERKGGKVVDEGHVGNVNYAIGGKAVSRVLPEILAGVGFMVWLGGTSLSPPALLIGLGLWGILGGMMLRAVILSSVYWHGMGHAAVVSALGKQNFKQLMHSYESSLSFEALVPFSTIFIPGLSSKSSAPSMAALEADSPSLGNRVAALAGPLSNLMVVGLVAPFLGMTGISDFTYLALAAVAGVNLWTVLTSVSDFQTAITGIARVFACGVIGVVYGGPNAKGAAMPVGLQSVLDTAVRRTLHRGGQSGGVAAIAVKENGHSEFSYFVEKVAKEKNRRLRLGKLMRDASSRISDRAEKDGYGGLKRVVAVAHTRYGTNLAQPIALNAHPHLGSNHEDTIVYIGEGGRDDHYERPWNGPRAKPAVKSIAMPRGVAIAHNGDDNATAVSLDGEKSIYITNDEDALLSEHMTGFKNPAEGDSPQIATRMERWITQGSVMASLRLALFQTGVASLAGKNTHFAEILERAPTPGLLNGLLQTQALQSFEREVVVLLQRHPQANRLENLFAAAGARVQSNEAFWDLEERVPFERGSDIEGLRNRFAGQADAFLQNLPWFNDLQGHEQKELAQVFSDLFLKFYFTGDFRRSGIHLLRRADSTSTHGVMNTTVLEGESAQWLRQNQPFYVWVTEDGKSLAGSSESKAFLGGKIGDSLFRYRLTLRNGEVATLRENRLVIDHVEKGRVAEYDFDHMDRVTEERRWLDLENSPYVSPSSSLETAPEQRVREDEEMIPWVNETLKEEFSDPASHNSQTGRAFVTLLMNRLTKKKKGIDLVIVGTEKSFDAGNQHAETLRKLSSMAGRPLNIEVVYAAEFSRKDLVKLRDKGFGADTLVLGVASSGQTANTMYVLESLNKAWEGLSEASERTSVEGKTPPHFLVSADIDNPYTEEVLGQGLAKGDPFIARNFVTFPGLDSFHPSEAATVTHKATERLLKEVSVLFAESLAQRSRRWKSGGLAAGVPETVRQMVDNGDELDRRITGLDANGNSHLKVRQTGEVNDIPDQIQSMANRMQGAFLETLWATAATALFVSVTLMLHQTPASVLLGWFPNGAFPFAQGLPVLAAIVGMLTLGGVAWKTKMWKWSLFLGLLGMVTVLGGGLFLGESLFIGVDALGHAMGWGGIGSSLGHLPIYLDVSPVNIVNILSYVFFFFAATLGMRQVTGRPLWDRLGGRILVVSDAQHSVARLSAARWRRLVNQRFAWMGLNSVNESSLGRLTHEEALNSNVRGNIYLLGESRDTVGPTVMNYKQLGGSPNGPGRIWRMGIGHKQKGEESPAYSEGYISLAMKGDNPAGDDLDLAEIQDLIQDGPARDTAGMVLALRVAEKMSSVKPLNFVPGMTSSEAKTSTTQQPFAPLSETEVRDVFGLGASRSLVSEPSVESPSAEEEMGGGTFFPTVTTSEMASTSVSTIEKPAVPEALSVPAEIDRAELIEEKMKDDPQNGDSFVVSSTPKTVAEDDASTVVAQKDHEAWKEFRRTWITGPIQKLARMTVFLIAAISLTSWGGNLMMGIDRTLSQIFNRPAFGQERGSRGHLENIEFWTSKLFSVATPKGSPTTTEAGNVSGQKLSSSTTKVSVVNTRETGLISYENHPYEGVRFLGKVEPSVVRVLHRDGVWVNVNANGRAGWIHSKHLFNLKGGRARVVNTSSLFDVRPFVNGGKRGRFAKEAALEVLEVERGWSKVRALGSEAAPVWVSGRFLKAVPAGQTDSSVKSEIPQTRGDTVPSVVVQPSIGKGSLAPLLVPMVPLLGILGKRRVPVSTSPGALLRQRLLSGARRGWEGENIPVAKAVLAFAENPSDTAWGDKGIRLALGYGALAGGTWAKDRPLVNDFRRTREELKGQPLTVLEGRRLTGLARLASTWERASTPSYVDGALQVLNLTSAEEETQLFHHWAVALDRVVTHGGQMPVLIAQSSAQRDRLEASLNAWRAENRSLGLEIPTGQTRWVYSDTLSTDVADRDDQGVLHSVRMGALLTGAKVDIRNVQSIDLVTGVQPDWIWDRSDLPNEVAVRLIIGVLKDLSLSAPLDSAQNAIRSARKALTAA